jgi:hypothetical protein
MFARALDRCGVLATELVFVWDHPDIDIEGPRRAGLMPVWKRMPYWEVPCDVLKIDHSAKFCGSVYRLFTHAILLSQLLTHSVQCFVLWKVTRRERS